MAKQQGKTTGVILGPAERRAVEQAAQREGISLSAVVRRSVRRDLVKPQGRTVVDSGPTRQDGDQ